MCTGVQGCTGTAVVPINVDARSSILTCAQLTTFIYIICAVRPSPTTNTDTAVSVSSVHTVTIILTRCINCTIVKGSTVWTSVGIATHAGVAIPRVNAGTSVHTRLGGTEINVFTAGASSPPGGAVAGERFNINNRNIRALPTI